MYILSENSNDAGHQLEELSRAILQTLPFQSIVVRSIDVGGSEIDIVADFIIPGFAQSTPVLICECKARQDAINMNDWLKFLGKVYLNDKVSGSTTYGCLIALNGANGNVMGAYRSLARNDDRVNIIESSRLLELAHQRSWLCSPTVAESKIRSRTQRTLRELTPAYRSGQFFWICGFDDGIVAILNNAGEVVSDEQNLALLPLLSNVSSYVDVLDFRQEDLAVVRTAYAVKLLVSFAFSSPFHVNDAKARHNDLSAEVDDVLPQLVTNSWLRLADDKYLLSKDGDWLPRFFLMVRLVLEEPSHVSFVYKVLASDEYQTNVRKHALEYGLNIHKSLMLTKEEAAKVQKIVNISPSALMFWTVENQLLEQHASEDLGDNSVIAEIDKGIMLNNLVRLLRKDFRNPLLMGYFYKDCGISEMIERSEMVFRGDGESNLIGTVANAYKIGIASEELGGIFLSTLSPLVDEDLQSDFAVDEDSVRVAYEKIASGQCKYGANGVEVEF